MTGVVWNLGVENSEVVYRVDPLAPVDKPGELVTEDTEPVLTLFNNPKLPGPLGLRGPLGGGGRVRALPFRLMEPKVGCNCC